jgi:hypothetical protein
MIQPLANTAKQLDLDYDAEQEQAQSWWQMIQPHCDWFFDVGTALDAHTPRAHRAAVLLDLSLARQAIEAADYPLSVVEARQYLLDAVNAVITGLITVLNDDWRGAHQQLQTTRRALNRLDLELDQLGVA